MYEKTPTAPYYFIALVQTVDGQPGDKRFAYILCERNLEIKIKPEKRDLKKVRSIKQLLKDILQLYIMEKTYSIYNV